MNSFQNLIKEICEEEKIKFSLLSKDWIIMLEKNEKIKFISGYKFDLASHGIGNVMDDKYATYEILNAKNIPVIPHHILFSRKNKNDYAQGCNRYEEALKLFEKYNHNIVIKANNGTCGTEVFSISKKEEIEPCLDQLFVNNNSVSICPFYQIQNEYRLIMLGKECLLMYGKKRPIVIGDGKKTKRELLMEFNSLYFESRLKDECWNEILPNGEKFEYHWQFNLSNGAIPMEITNIGLQERLLKIANKITNCFDVCFCSIDVVKTTENEFFVMELNSGVMMLNYMKLVKDGKIIAKKIYKKAILKMFEDEINEKQ